MNLHPLTPSLWTGQSRFFYTNAGIFVSGSHTCLVDPNMTPAEMAALRTFLTEQHLFVDLLVLTHYHWDHILGPEVFPGVTVVAHRLLPEVLAGPEGKSTLAAIADWEAENGIERTQPFVLPTPDRLVADGSVLAVGDLQLEVIHTPGHSPDQIALYDAANGTLWASDILSDVEIPFISHSLAAFETTLIRLAQLEVAVLVPGHGYPSTTAAAYQQRIAEDRRYLADLRERIEVAVAAGKSLAETVKSCAHMTFRNPEENADPHRRNVESVYAELGGNADPACVGWNQPDEGANA